MSCRPRSGRGSAVAEREIPQRVKAVHGKFVPEFPGECEPHTPAPSGYGAFFDWAEGMSEDHVQRQCVGCGLWAVWEPKAASDG